MNSETTELHCIIHGCEQRLDGVVKTEACLKRMGAKLKVMCNNGVGWKHVKTASGKHYGINRKRE